MAGKEGAAAGRLDEVVEALAAVLTREARALAELAPSLDAGGAEKAAKAAKAIADAGRSLVAFAKAAASEAAAAEASEDAGMDMDDEHPEWDADELARRRERLVERFAQAPHPSDRTAAGDGCADLGGHGTALAEPLAPRPAPA